MLAPGEHNLPALVLEWNLYHRISSEESQVLPNEIQNYRHAKLGPASNQYIQEADAETYFLGSTKGRGRELQVVISVTAALPAWRKPGGETPSKIWTVRPATLFKKKLLLTLIFYLFFFFNLGWLFLCVGGMFWVFLSKYTIPKVKEQN